MSSTINYMDSEVTLNFDDAQIYHDRVLVVEEKKFYVVSGILSMWSEHFRGLFNGNFNEGDKKEIELKELDSEEFELFLRLLYQNNSVSLKDTDIIPLIELSYRFLAPMVLKICMEYINKNFEKLNEIILDLLNIACIYENKILKEKMINYFNDKPVLMNCEMLTLLEIASNHKLIRLVHMVVLSMVRNFSVVKCSEYLNVCARFHYDGLKSQLIDKIRDWQWNEIPPNHIIELTKTAFKYDIPILKQMIRSNIMCMTESQGSRLNRTRDGLSGRVEPTFNWFLKDYQEEIFALPAEIIQFIMISTVQREMDPV